MRLRLWRDGREPVSALADNLRDAQPLRAEDAYGKMFSLLLLGANDDAIVAWDTLRDAEFWEDKDTRQNSFCAYFAGLAALRQGDSESAGELFAEAYDLDPDNLDADKALLALALQPLGREVDAKAGEFHDWFPQSWITNLRTAKGAQAQEAAIEAQQRRCDAHADYLAAAAELGGFAVRFYATSILQLRARDGDGTALATLRSLLVRPCGTDQDRLTIERWLQENGFVEAGEPQQVLLNGEVRELELREMLLHAEPTSLALPAASQARLEKMHRLLKQNDIENALHIAEELAASHPRQPTLVANVASIKDALGHDIDEVEAQFQRAAELDPTYLFAQAGLVRVAARKGDIERARALLTPLKSGEKYHFSDWRAILLAEREIAAARPDMATVFRLDDALRKLHEQFG